jgi:branched-chain amino acid transport system substrate-binding protein
LRRAALLAVAFVCAGCQTAPSVPGSDRQAYQAALRLHARDPEAGAAALRDFVEARPGSPLADDAALRLAETLVEQARDDEALRRLAWVLRAHPEGDRSDAARLLLARLQRARGQPAPAYRTAQGVRLSLLESERRLEAERLLAELAGEAGDRAGRLRWLARVRADGPAADAERVDGEIEAALAELSPADLERVAGELGRTVPAGRVRLRQAEQALGRGEREEAERFLARASQLPLAPADAERLAAFEARLAGRPIADPGAPSAFPDATRLRGTLGVVLPLTGELAAAGGQTLDGILLASGVLDGAPPPSDAATPGTGLRLRVLDTAGDPAAAATAVRELGADPALLAVLGPLTAEETLASAPEADRLGLPLVTFTRHGEAAAGHPAVFRIGLTPDAEAACLAEYAAGTLGLRRVGILHPQDAYGERMSALFSRAFEARGGGVASVASYPADATDFSGAIRLLIRGAGGTPAEPSRATPEAEPPAGVPGGFDGIFVPDAYRAASLIAPALAFAGVRGVRLLGTSAWNDPSLVAVGREHVEGAVFTGAVVRDGGSPILAEFAARFRAGFGRPPDALAALGFDGALLLLRGVVAGGSTREALRGGLLAAGPLEGVSGTTDFTADGNAERRPHLLGVEAGAIVDLEDIGRPPLLPRAPAPEAPAPATPRP